MTRITHNLISIFSQDAVGLAGGGGDGKKDKKKGDDDDGDDGGKKKGGGLKSKLQFTVGDVTYNILPVLCCIAILCALKVGEFYLY